MKKYEHFSIFALFVIFGIFLSHKLIFSHGLILHHDWPIPPYKSQYADFSELFCSWDSRFGGMENLQRGATLLALMNRLLVLSAPIDGEILSKLYLVLSLSLSGFFMYYLLRRGFRKSCLSSTLAGVFYVLSPFMFERVVCGDIYRLIGYALLPLLFTFYLTSARVKSIRLRAAYLLAISLLFLFVDFITTFIIIVLFILFNIFEIAVSSHMRKEVLLRSVMSLTIIFVVLFILNMYTVLPSVLYGSYTRATGLPLTDFKVRSLVSQLINVIRLEGTLTRFFASAIEGNQLLCSIWMSASFLIIAFVFLPLLFRKNKEVIFFSMVAVVALFLAKGMNPPLAQANVWIYLNVTGFLREPTKWLMLASFAYSFLFSASIEQFHDIAQSLLLNKEKHSIIIFKTKKINKMVTVYLVIPLLLLSIYSWPMLTGDFAGMLKNANFPKEYEELNEWLSEQHGDFRVLWLPPGDYIAYDWLEYQQSDIPYFHYHRDLFALYSPKPNLARPYPPSDPFAYFSHYVISSFYRPQTKYLGKLLSVVGVKYIIVRNDAEGWIGYTKDQLQSIIQKQAGIKLIKTFGSIDVYLNEYYDDNWRLSAAYEIGAISGGYSSLATLSYLDNPELKNMPLIFMEDPLAQKYLTSTDKVFLLDNDFFSLVSAFLDRKYVIAAATYADSESPLEGWSKLYLNNNWHLDQRHLNTLEDCALTYSNKSLIIPFTTITSDIYEVWIRLFNGPKGSSLFIELDDDELGSLNTNSGSAGFCWVQIGSIYLNVGEHVLKVRQNAGEQLVDKIVIAPQREVSNAIKSAIEFIQKRDLLLLYEAEKLAKTSAEVIYYEHDFAKDGISDWRLNAVNCDFSYRITEDGLQIDAYFNGSKEEIEQVEIYKKEAFDLKDFPFVEITYAVEDPEITTVHLYFELDFNNDGIVDAGVTGPKFYEFPAPTVLSSFKINAYDLVREFYPNEKSYKVICLKIIPVKYWPVNLSGEGKDVQFTIKNIKVFRYSSSEENFPLDASNGIATTISDNRSISFRIFTPKEGNYSIYFRLLAPSGGKIELKTTNDQTSVLEVEPTKEFKWYKVMSINLNFGFNHFFLHSHGNVTIDFILMQSKDQDSPEAPSLIYNKISSAKYEIRAKSSKSFFLVLGDSFDNRWRLSVNGEFIDPFPVSPYLNGFLINKSGELIINLDFSPDNIFKVLLPIYFSGVIFITAYCGMLMYTSKKRKTLDGEK